MGDEEPNPILIRRACAGTASYARRDAFRGEDREGRRAHGADGRRAERRRGVLVVLVGWLFFLSAGFSPFSFPAYFARETEKKGKNKIFYMYIFILAGLHYCVDYLSL